MITREIRGCHYIAQHRTVPNSRGSHVVRTPITAGRCFSGPSITAAIHGNVTESVRLPREFLAAWAAFCKYPASGYLWRSAMPYMLNSQSIDAMSLHTILGVSLSGPIKSICTAVYLSIMLGHFVHDQRNQRVVLPRRRTRTFIG